MMVGGTEYVVATKPLCWGGGRYVQIKVDLQGKVLNCVADVQKKEKITNSKALGKD